MSALGAVVAAELIKLRTVRSTPWTLPLTAVVGVGLGALVSWSFRGMLARPVDEQQGSADPLFAAFYGLTLAQLALVVFAVLVVSGEYGSGTIRASLAAVPRRGLFYAGKLFAAALPIAVVALVTVLATFFVAQAVLGPYGVSATDAGVPRTIFGAWLYLVLIGLFALGVATMLRGTARSLGILLPLFFLGSQGLGNIPKVRTVTQYLPDQTGQVIMHIVGSPEAPAFDRSYGPWTGMALLALWTGAALLGGYLVLRRRDA